MKAITKLFLVLFFAILCIGCEKIDKGQNTQEDFYYVRFDGKYQNGGGTAKFSLTGCGTFTKYIGIPNSFSEILGPAQKGAVAKVDAGGNCELSIYVSKNNSPFALKKTGGNTLSYTIDF